jgi:hypothetical protein
MPELGMMLALVVFSVAWNLVDDFDVVINQIVLFTNSQSLTQMKI